LFDFSICIQPIKLPTQQHHFQLSMIFIYNFLVYRDYVLGCDFSS